MREAVRGKKHVVRLHVRIEVARDLIEREFVKPKSEFSKNEVVNANLKLQMRN